MKPSLRVLLLGNGESLPADFLKELAQQADLIVATDGGADKALAKGVSPHAIIGDLDSVSPFLKNNLPNARWIHVPRQDNTDLEKALDWLCAQGYTQCTLCGFTGGRMDFSLGNILSLYPYISKMKLTVCGPGWQLLPVLQKITVPCLPKKRVSLLPYKTCRGVYTTGLKYPLAAETLSWKRAGRSLSNQTTGVRFSVSLTSGLLWVYVEN